ncbi:MAG TPA: ribosome maturation factor RimP [Solirubrobacteraceae bacterium]|nr:ribosome maturation factor RimP [Solirubrobacteraceae bacterium]
MTPLQKDIEERLAEREPDVEVLLVEQAGGDTLRVFIDHPEGVTLALCERVTHALAELREHHTLEVSSPGVERPLTKPDHFRRFVGRRARVRTGSPPAPPALAPADIRAAAARSRRSYTGELVGASDTEIALAADGGVVTIPYTQIRRSNLIGE